MMKIRQKLKITLFIIVYFLTIYNLKAQLFNITYIDTTEFPKMKAGFIAKNFQGNDYTGITNLDFKLFENGVDYAPSAKVECKGIKRIPPISVALILDVSNSMNEELQGEKKFQWVKDGAKAFFDSVKLEPPSAGCVITFASTVTYNSGWSSDNAKLKNEIDYNVKYASGTTNFKWPFEEWKSPQGSYESFKLRPTNIRRVVIFLSDGDPEQPFTSADADYVIKHCLEQKIEVYAIIIETPPHQQLERVCRTTGGNIYQVFSKWALINKYQEIVGKIQSQNVCELVWDSPMNCDTTNLKRNLKVVFKPIPDSVQTSFNVPKDAVAKLEVSSQQLLFGAPSIGTTQRQLTITAKNANFTITKETLTPNQYFKVNWGKTLPFTLNKDQSHTLTIDYIESPPTPSKEVNLRIEASPCPSELVSLIAPCGGDFIQKVDFGDVAVSTSSDKTENCIFKNTTFVEITGDVKLEGSNAADFTIISGGGPFKLKPNECLKMVIRANPSSEGKKTAEISFNIPNVCGNPKTSLVVNAVNSSFPMPTLDFGVKRELTSNDSVYVITNSTSVPIKITDIALKDQNVKDFVLNLPNLPLDLASGAKLNIPVNFTPSKEGLINNDIEITIDNNPNKPSGKITGIGGLPKLSAMPVSFGSIKVLGKITKDVELINTSTTMDLYIQNIELEAQTENNFTIVSGTKLNDIFIPKNNGSIKIPIDFVPLSSGYKTVNLFVTNDFKKGPEKFPLVVTSVKLDGSGIGVEMKPSPLDFGNVLACGVGITKQIKVTNNSLENWKINKITFNGTGKNAFSSNSQNLVINSNSDGLINITFTPTIPINYSASLDVEIDAGSAGILVGSGLLEGNGIKGTAKTIITNANQVNDTLVPGYSVPLEFRMDIPSYVNNFDQLEIEFKHNPLMINGDGNTLKISGALSGWNWTFTEKKGIFVLNGKGTPVNGGNSFTGKINIMSFISDKESDLLMIQPKFFGANSCIEGEVDTINLKNKICFSKGYLVNFGSGNYYLNQVEPNPLINNSKIKFGIGIKANTKLELYDNLGQLIEVLLDEQIDEGNYEIDLNINNLKNGVYFYKLTSAQFIDIKKLIINR